MKQKLLVILGSTSTGKTDLGIILAQKFNGEIISADSRQVYKYLDIGTGKLPGSVSSIKGQVSRGKEYWVVNGIKIWMYDVTEPKTRFNLYEYILRAEKVIRNITDRNKLPILVGGSGLYIRSLLKGVSDFGVSEDIKLRLNYEKLDTNEIRKRINQLNPEVLKKLNNSELNNKRRLIRIVEKLINQGIGKSFQGIEKDFDVLKIGLKADKKILYKRIVERVVNRMEQGMVEESKDLLKRGILSEKRMEELGLEYRYIAKYLKGEIKTVDELVEILSLKIRQFAKRQETWFKKEKNTEWFDIEDKETTEKVEYRVLNWYNTMNESKD